PPVKFGRRNCSIPPGSRPLSPGINRRSGSHAVFPATNPARAATVMVEDANETQLRKNAIHDTKPGPCRVVENHRRISAATRDGARLPTSAAAIILPAHFQPE